MSNYKITLYWKGLPQGANNIGTFIVDESELELLEENYGNDLSIDVWDTTSIKRNYTFADVLRTINESSSQNFGALVYKGLMDDIDNVNKRHSLTQ